MDEQITISEVISAHFDYSMQDKYTALPGVVLKVHDKGSRQLLDVQPSVSIKNRDGSVTPQSTILNVPYGQSASSQGGTVFPIKEGDSVLLVFCMRGIDTWKYGDGSPAPSSDYRMFHKMDCIAIPGIFPTNKAVAAQDKHSGDYELGDTIVFNKGTEIILKQNGDVVVNATNVKINAAKTTISGDLEVEGESTFQGIAFSTHKHTGVDTGGGTSGGPV